MKVWIDITNSPHVLFFRPIIERLSNQGHQIEITTRKFAQTIDLLDFFQIKYTIIGEHAGKSKYKKALEYFSRSKKLYNFIKNKKIDIAISHQSPYSMRAAKKAKISKRVYIFDNEKAIFQNLLAIPYANLVLCPKIIANNRFLWKRISKYPGLKEEVYLYNFKPKNNPIKNLSLDPNKKNILFRPEPWAASYYRGKQNSTIDLIKELNKKFNMIIIPRDSHQKELLKHEFREKVVIFDKAIFGPELIFWCDLIISAGGTMNREAVVLGKPVLSIYNSDLLAVDKWLIKKGYMYHNTNPDINYIQKIIKQQRNKKSASKGDGLEYIYKRVFE